MAQGWPPHELKKLRAKSLIALVNVFLAFEFKECVSADEVIELFVESGVLDKLSVSIVTNAFTGTAFGKTNIVKHSEGRKRSHYFLAVTEKENVSLPDGRPFSGNFIKPSNQSISSYLDTVNSYLKTLPDPAKVTPDKKKPPVVKICCGFVGKEVDEMFTQSFLDGPLQNYSIKDPFPR